MDARFYVAVFLGAAFLAGPASSAGKDPQTLLITVLQTDDAGLARGLLANTAASGVAVPGYQTTTRIYGTDSVRPPRGFQQVRVIEGQRALYSTSSSSPEVRFLWAEDNGRRLLPNVGVDNRETESGFYVQADLQADEVLLQLDRFNGQSRRNSHGHGLRQNIRTTVNGRVGDWLDAGGSLLLDEDSPVNHSYYLPRRDEAHTRLLIKVELAPE
ncbi:MAG: hypothetical protein WBP44_02120 [Gammaproteobacteria bacterium]|jgi:hypothetical protein